MKYKLLQEVTMLEVFDSGTENNKVYSKLIEYFPKANFKIDENNSVNQTDSNFNFLVV